MKKFLKKTLFLKKKTTETYGSTSSQSSGRNNSTKSLISNSNLDETSCSILMDLLEVMVAKRINDSKPLDLLNTPAVYELTDDFLKGNASRENFEKSDINTLWSALIGIIKKSDPILSDKHCTDLQRATPSEVMRISSDLQLHHQKLLGALFAANEVLIDGDRSSGELIAEHLSVVLIWSLAPDPIAKRDAFCTLVGDYRQFFPFCYTFSRKIGMEIKPVPRRDWVRFLKESSESSVVSEELEALRIKKGSSETLTNARLELSQDMDSDGSNHKEEQKLDSRVQYEHNVNANTDTKTESSNNSSVGQEKREVVKTDKWRSQYSEELSLNEIHSSSSRSSRASEVSELDAESDEQKSISNSSLSNSDIPDLDDYNTKHGIEDKKENDKKKSDISNVPPTVVDQNERKTPINKGLIEEKADNFDSGDSEDNLSQVSVEEDDQVGLKDLQEAFSSSLVSSASLERHGIKPLHDEDYADLKSLIRNINWNLAVEPLADAVKNCNTSETKKGLIGWRDFLQLSKPFLLKPDREYLRTTKKEVYYDSEIPKLTTSPPSGKTLISLDKKPEQKTPGLTEGGADLDGSWDDTDDDDVDHFIKRPQKIDLHVEGKNQKEESNVNNSSGFTAAAAADASKTIQGLSEKDKKPSSSIGWGKRRESEQKVIERNSFDSDSDDLNNGQPSRISENSENSSAGYIPPMPKVNDSRLGSRQKGSKMELLQSNSSDQISTVGKSQSKEISSQSLDRGEKKDSAGESSFDDSIGEEKQNFSMYRGESSTEDSITIKPKKDSGMFNLTAVESPASSPEKFRISTEPERLIPSTNEAKTNENLSSSVGLKSSVEVDKSTFLNEREDVIKLQRTDSARSAVSSDGGSVGSQGSQSSQGSQGSEKKKRKFGLKSKFKAVFGFKSKKDKLKDSALPPSGPTASESTPVPVNSSLSAPTASNDLNTSKHGIAALDRAVSDSPPSDSTTSLKPVEPSTTRPDLRTAGESVMLKTDAPAVNKPTGYGGTQISTSPTTGITDVIPSSLTAAPVGSGNESKRLKSESPVMKPPVSDEILPLTKEQLEKNKQHQEQHHQKENQEQQLSRSVDHSNLSQTSEQQETKSELDAASDKTKKKKSLLPKFLRRKKKDRSPPDNLGASTHSDASNVTQDHAASASEAGSVIGDNTGKPDDSRTSKDTQDHSHRDDTTSNTNRESITSETSEPAVRKSRMGALFSFGRRSRDPSPSKAPPAAEPPVGETTTGGTPVPATSPPTASNHPVETQTQNVASTSPPFRNTESPPVASPSTITTASSSKEPGRVQPKDKGKGGSLLKSFQSSRSSSPGAASEKSLEGWGHIQVRRDGTGLAARLRCVAESAGKKTDPLKSFSSSVSVAHLPDDSPDMYANLSKDPSVNWSAAYNSLGSFTGDPFHTKKKGFPLKSAELVDSRRSVDDVDRRARLEKLRKTMDRSKKASEESSRITDSLVSRDESIVKKLSTQSDKRSPKKEKGLSLMEDMQRIRETKSQRKSNQDEVIYQPSGDTTDGPGLILEWKKILGRRAPQNISLSEQDLKEMEDLVARHRKSTAMAREQRHQAAQKRAESDAMRQLTAPLFALDMFRPTKGLLGESLANIDLTTVATAKSNSSSSKIDVINSSPSKKTQESQQDNSVIHRSLTAAQLERVIRQESLFFSEWELAMAIKFSGPLQLKGTKRFFVIMLDPSINPNLPNLKKSESKPELNETKSEQALQPSYTAVSRKIKKQEKEQKADSDQQQLNQFGPESPLKALSSVEFGENKIKELKNNENKSKEETLNANPLSNIIDKNEKSTLTYVLQEYQHVMPTKWGKIPSRLVRQVSLSHLLEVHTSANKKKLSTEFTVVFDTGLKGEMTPIPEESSEVFAEEKNSEPANLSEIDSVQESVQEQSEDGSVLGSEADSAKSHSIATHSTMTRLHPSGVSKNSVLADKKKAKDPRYIVLHLKAETPADRLQWVQILQKLANNKVYSNTSVY